MCRGGLVVRESTITAICWRQRVRLAAGILAEKTRVDLGAGESPGHRGGCQSCAARVGSRAWSARHGRWDSGRRDGPEERWLSVGESVRSPVRSGPVRSFLSCPAPGRQVVALPAPFECSPARPHPGLCSRRSAPGTAADWSVSVVSGRVPAVLGKLILGGVSGISTWRSSCPGIRRREGTDDVAFRGLGQCIRVRYCAGSVVGGDLSERWKRRAPRE